MDVLVVGIEVAGRVGFCEHRVKRCMNGVPFRGGQDADSTEGIGERLRADDVGLE